MGGPVPNHIIKGDDQCFLAYFDIIEKSLEMAVVMQAQNVDLYINGHDHYLEYIKHSDRYPFISYSSCLNMPWMPFRPSFTHLPMEDVFNWTKNLYVNSA
jgi:hypothetical protein